MQVTATESPRIPSMWNVECHLRRFIDLENLTQVSAARAAAAAMTSQAMQDGLILFPVNSPVVHLDIGRPFRLSSVGTAGGL